MRTGKVVVFVVILVVFLAGCGGDGEPGPDLTAVRLTQQGWARFEHGDFRGALARFNQAIARDASFGEAYNGLGWSCVKIDSLGAGLEAFGEAIAMGVATADPRAGKAVILRDREPVDFTQAIAWADSALAIAPQYVFSHDVSFNWRDLRLILAQSYFALSRYQEAKAQVDILKPGNTLDPSSATFIEDLLAEIQKLGNQI